MAVKPLPLSKLEKQTKNIYEAVVVMSKKVVGYKYNVAHHQTFNYMDIGLK